MNVIPYWFDSKHHTNVYLDVCDIATGMATEFQNGKFYFVKFLEDFEGQYCVAKITRTENKNTTLQIDIVKIQNKNKSLDCFEFNLTYSIIEFVKYIEEVLYTTHIR